MTTMSLGRRAGTYGSQKELNRSSLWQVHRCRESRHEGAEPWKSVRSQPPPGDR